LMVAETEGAASIPEKLERVAGRARGAIALLTPDDFAVSVATGQASARTRQNVTLEIGWFWARLGRSRCLLLKRGDLEVPSDLSGADIHAFRESPNECSEVVRDFMERLETSAEA